MQNNWKEEANNYKNYIEKKYKISEDIKSNIKNSEENQILKFANLISNSEYSLHGRGTPNPLVHKKPAGVNCRFVRKCVKD